MKKMLSILALGLMAATVNAMVMPEVAVTDLRITEVSSYSSGAAVDWFEITNTGTSVYNLDTNRLYYCDDSAKPADAKRLKGITEVAPGESVVFLIGSGASSSFIDPFKAIWGENVNNVQIGYIDSTKGLGTSGDGVYLFPSQTAGTAAYTSVDFGAMGMATFVSDGEYNWLGDTAVVGVLGAYQSNAFLDGAGASVTMIGSPGLVVPEPATISLVAIAGLAALRRRK